MSRLAVTAAAIRRVRVVEVHRLDQDDIFEVEGTFYAPVKK